MTSQTLLLLLMSHCSKKEIFLTQMYNLEGWYFFWKIGSVFVHSLQLMDKGTKVQTLEKSTLLCKFCRFLHRRCSIHAVFTSTCLSIFMSVCKSQSNGFVLANNVSQDGLWILMWLS